MATTQNDLDLALQASPSRGDTPAMVATSIFPHLDDAAWVGVPVVTGVSDGKEGTTVRRSLSGAYGGLALNSRLNLDRTKVYKVIFWCRAAAGTNGTLYFTLRQYLADGKTTGPGNGGRDPYRPGALDAASASAWTKIESKWTSADWQTGVTMVQPDFLMNYRSDSVTKTGYWEIQGFRMIDITEAEAAQAKADTAFADAAAATLAITNISSNGVLDRSEKATLAREFDSMAAEFDDLIAKADAIGVSRSAFYTSKVDLNNYLAGLGANNAWRDTSFDTNIVRADFDFWFKNYYDKRALLVNAIAAKASTMASGVTLTATGALMGAGGGQIETTPVIDRLRESNHPPSWFPVGTTREFKHAAAIGLEDVNGYWATLETIKQYTHGGGGYPGYQYCYQHGRTWRRHSVDDAGSAWSSWTQDLDRNAYTGSLNATEDLKMILDDVKQEGNTFTRTRATDADWGESQAFSANGFRAAFCSGVASVQGAMLAMSVNPGASAHWNTLNYAIHLSGGSIDVYEQGYFRGNFGAFAADDLFAIEADKASVRYYRNGYIFLTRPSNHGDSLIHLDLTFYSLGSQWKHVRFGPLSSNDQNDMNIGMGINLLSNSMPFTPEIFQYGGASAGLAVEGNGFAMVPRGHSFDIYSPIRQCGYTRVTVDPGVEGKYAGVYVHANNKIPVKPNSRYEFSAWLSQHRCDAKLFINWYNNAGSYIGAAAVSFPRTVNENKRFDSSSWPRSAVFATAPADASYAMPSFELNPNAGYSDSYLFYSGLHFGIAGQFQTTPSEWTDGPVKVITGGAISNYAWPPAGQTGFYLGQEGLLIGNANDGRFFQVNNVGNVFTPMFEIVNGVASLKGVVLATDGYMRSGQTAYDTGSGFFLGDVGGNPKFSMATPNGAKFLCDPVNNILKLVNATVQQPAASAVINGDTTGELANNTSLQNFSSGVSATVTGGSGTYTYSWTFNQEGGAGTISITNPTTNAPILKSRGTNTYNEGTLTVTINDTVQGRSYTASTYAGCGHGAYL